MNELAGLVENVAALRVVLQAESANVLVRSAFDAGRRVGGPAAAVAAVVAVRRRRVSALQRALQRRELHLSLRLRHLTHATSASSR